MNCCKLKVGDEVDWKDIFNPHQGRWWHGEVLQDLGVGILRTQHGHKFLVQWSLGTKWTRFRKLPEGRWFTPTPNGFQEVKTCQELLSCVGPSPLHPPTLHGGFMG